MRESVFDLRKFNVPWFRVGLGVTAVVATTALWAAAAGQVSGGSDGRTVAAVIGGLFALVVVLGLARLRKLRHPHRLVVDHEGIRVDGRGADVEFRLAWTELAGVTVLVNDRRRRREARRHVRFLELPPAATPVAVAIELVPAEDEARRRHPELARAWEIGRRRAWRVRLAYGPGEPPDFGTALRQHRPDLWRGERSGPALFR